jgi:GNAT superfamily N-acetyltransferase
MKGNEERTMPGLSPTPDARAPVVPPGYPRQLEREMVAADGLCFRVRPIRPDDAGRLVEFHRQLSPHSVYLRFFTFHPTLSAVEVARFTTVDYVDRLALVAAEGDRLIAVGRFDRFPGTTEAEVAFIVADEFQHHGIGALLLDELVKAARDRGIETFTAQTLAENKAMLDVFRHAGFPVTSRIEFGTVTVQFPIAPSDTARAAAEARAARWRVPDAGDTT